MDEKYFVAKIQYDLIDENSGKIKKVREEKLVKGYSVTDVEAKVTEKFKSFQHFEGGSTHLSLIGKNEPLVTSKVLANKQWRASNS